MHRLTPRHPAFSEPKTTSFNGQAPPLATGCALLSILFVGTALIAACGREEVPTTPALPAARPPPTPPAPPPPPEPAGPIVLAVDFDSTPLGAYTQGSFDSNWPSYQYVNGLELSLTEVIGGPPAYSGRSLRHKFTGGKRVEDHWIHGKINLPRSYEELYFSYRVRFEHGFDWVKGGKLPGLFGGRGNTGGNVPDGSDGWSGRMMWRQSGEATQYIYHPDQAGMYGSSSGGAIVSSRARGIRWSTTSR